MVINKTLHPLGAPSRTRLMLDLPPVLFSVFTHLSFSCCLGPESSRTEGLRHILFSPQFEKFSFLVYSASQFDLKRPLITSVLGDFPQPLLSLKATYNLVQTYLNPVIQPDTSAHYLLNALSFSASMLELMNFSQFCLSSKAQIECCLFSWYVTNLHFSFGPLFRIAYLLPPSR